MPFQRKPCLSGNIRRLILFFSPHADFASEISVD